MHPLWEPVCILGFSFSQLDWDDVSGFCYEIQFVPQWEHFQPQDFNRYAHSGFQRQAGEEGTCLVTANLLVQHYVETLHRSEEGRPIVPTAGVDLPIQRGHPQPAPLGQHGHGLRPALGLGVVHLRQSLTVRLGSSSTNHTNLDTVKYWQPVMSSQCINFAKKLDNSSSRAVLKY